MSELDWLQLVHERARLLHTLYVRLKLSLHYACVRLYLNAKN